MRRPRTWRIAAIALLSSLCSGWPAHGQTMTDPWAGVAFLEGTWTANASGDQNATATGHYKFGRELDNHVLARHGATATCKGPDDFDCDHNDLFYVFQDAPGQPLKAIYFDNEGHVIHYAVATPAPNHVVFLSEPGPGPRFRLMYERDGTSLAGRFQIQMPGQDAWHSYLEWTGGRE